MSQKNETAVLVLALIITAALLAAGFWWFTRNQGSNIVSTPQDATPKPSSNSNQPPTTTAGTFPLPTTVPAGTSIRIDGSTSMVQINQALKNSFEKQFPGTVVNTKAGGSDQGVQAVLGGSADVAAISRPLTQQEQSQGLAAVPIARDAIAIVVGNNNPFRKGLTSSQVVGIFQGQITNWSAVGGPAAQIQVINRPPFSGTHQAFRELVLQKGTFGTTPNIKTLQQDATTPLLRELGANGIGYATSSQVENQQTVRAVAVDGLTPEAANYPYKRDLEYAYKQPASVQVQAFLGYATSPQGQQAVSGIGK